MVKFLLFYFCLISYSSQAQTVGWFFSLPGSADGYILFPPTGSDTTYLIDKCGKKIHTWKSNYHPGLAAHLLANGNLLRAGTTNNPQFQGGGTGGIIEKFDWNGTLLWTYMISSDTDCQHHDVYQLPNGNVLAIAWESHTSIDAIENGRNPANVGAKMWSDKIMEIQPVGIDSGIVVWQWRAWDHLIQDFDSTRLNYGVVADHPELININLVTLSQINSDWLHCNSVQFDSVTNQLLISSHNLDEVFILDHSTTKSEVASHSGGVSGHGGDLMYRWGNPRNYGRGTIDDQKLFDQHNAQRIDAGFPGSGKILVFNNGVGRVGTDYTSVETFTLPAMVGNNYPIETDSAYEPDASDWIYTANPQNSFFCFVMGGAQRIWNGNTIICDAGNGHFFEVDSNGNEIWKYVNPVSFNGITEQGNTPFQNSSFRCTYLAYDYPGLAGHSLVPGAPIEKNPLSYVCYNNVPTEVDEPAASDKNLIAYPNPFTNNFNIHIPISLNHAVLRIRDVLGKILYQDLDFSSASESDISIELPNFKGILILSVNDASGQHVWNATMVGF
ncbi:MAG: aryl-sulfate sulfotransferase [Chitinophagales bacterium]